MQFSENQSLFGDISLNFTDPLTGKPILRQCTGQSAEATKKAIQRETLVNLCAWFLKNRNTALTWLENNHGQKVASEFKKRVQILTVNINRIPGILNLNDLADFMYLHVYPDIMQIAPKSANDKTARYLTLADQMEGIISGLRNNQILNTRTEKNAEFSVNL